MPDTDDVYPTLDLALRVGEVFLSSGAGAADVTATMLSITSACGLRNCEVDVTFTTLSLSFQPSDDRASVTRLRNLRLRSTNYAQLTNVDHLVRALVHSEITREQARSKLSAMMTSGHRYGRRVVSVAWGFNAAGTSLVIGGDWLVASIAFSVAVFVDVVRRQMALLRLPQFYRQFLGGLIATLVAVGAFAANVPVDPSLLVTAGIIMLLAGVAFVGALQDALSGFYVTAGARGLEALLLTGGIIAGVSAGLQVADRLGVNIVFLPVSASWSQLPLLLLGAALSAGGYAVASYAPFRSLIPIALVAVLAELIYRFVLIEGFGPAWGAASAAIAVGIVSYTAAGRVRVPPLVVLVSSIVPLLPGLSIYQGLFQIAESNTAGLISLATALGIAVALASGAILGEYVAQPLKREAHRVEARLAGPRLVGPFKPFAPLSKAARRHARRAEALRAEAAEETRADPGPKPNPEPKAEPESRAEPQPGPDPEPP